MIFKKNGLSDARSCAKKRETGHYPQQGGCRRYDGDMKEYASGLRGVIHCYSYSAEMAKEYVKWGYYIWNWRSGNF